MTLAEREAHRLALVDNRTGELAEWDEAERDEALAELNPDEELQALFGKPEKDAGHREDLEVEEIDVSTAIGARFWMTVEGPLAGQKDAIVHLRKALSKLEGVTVDVGMVE
jgi:hypothetical protein